MPKLAASVAVQPSGRSRRAVLAVDGRGENAAGVTRALARREGITRARVTQVLMLLRLAPDVQERVLAFPVTVDRPVLTERMLRPITFLEDAVRQQTTFSEMVAASSSR